MPRAKKENKKEVQSAKVAEKVSQIDVAGLTVDIVEVYKNKCITAISEFENLDMDQKREISRVFNLQETIVKSQIMNQIELMFK